MSVLYAIITFIVLVGIACFLEMDYDRKVAKAVDPGGRTPDEDKILHSWYVPIRIYIVALVTVSVYFAFQLVWWRGLLMGVAGAPLYGLVFNVMVAVWWLKKPWHYDRTGHGLRNALLKFLSCVIIFSLLFVL